MTTPLSENEQSANLALLRRLVTLLLIVMIAGFALIVFLFVMRLTAEPQATALPAEITLPDGTTTQAFTMGTDWYAIVTDDDRILVFNRSDNSLRQSIEINR